VPNRERRDIEGSSAQEEVGTRLQKIRMVHGLTCDMLEIKPMLGVVLEHVRGQSGGGAGDQEKGMSRPEGV